MEKKKAVERVRIMLDNLEDRARKTMDKLAEGTLELCSKLRSKPAADPVQRTTETIAILENRVEEERQQIMDRATESYEYVKDELADSESFSPEHLHKSEVGAE